MAFDWTVDSNSGVLKNHELSDKLLRVALGECKIVPFTRDYGISFGKNRGETVNIMNVKPMAEPTSTELEEHTKIPIDKTSIANRAITVKEYGRGVEWTNLMEVLSKFSPQQLHQKELTRQMEQSLDTMAALAFKSTDVKIVATPLTLTSLTFNTDGAPTTTAATKFTFDQATLIADYLADTLKAPPWEGGFYMGLTCNRNMRSLKQDRYFQAWHLYLRKGDFLYKGEVGATELIRWIEVNRTNAFNNAAGTSSIFGEGTIFGDEAVARIEVETPHLRLEKNYQGDFGRTQAAAWYGIMAFAPVWATANAGEAKMVRLDSL